MNEKKLFSQTCFFSLRAKIFKPILLVLAFWAFLPHLAVVAKAQTYTTTSSSSSSNTVNGQMTESSSSSYSTNYGSAPESTVTYGDSTGNQNMFGAKFSPQFNATFNNNFNATFDSNAPDPTGAAANYDNNLNNAPAASDNNLNDTPASAGNNLNNAPSDISYSAQNKQNQIHTMTTPGNHPSFGAYTDAEGNEVMRTAPAPQPPNNQYQNPYGSTFYLSPQIYTGPFFKPQDKPWPNLNFAPYPGPNPGQLPLNPAPKPLRQFNQGNY